MIRRPPRSTRTDTLFPYTTLFRYPLRKTGPVIMSEVYPLQDRIALVTGASSGLGRHFGLLLAVRRHLRPLVRCAGVRPALRAGPVPADDERGDVVRGQLLDGGLVVVVRVLRREGRVESQ